MTYVYIDGNYPEVLDVLKLPKDFYKPYDKAQYIEAIHKDIHRIRYFNGHATIKEQQQRLLDCSHLFAADNRLLSDNKPASYTQGDFFGEMLPSICFNLYFRDYELPYRSHYESIALNFVADNNELCALAIACINVQGQDFFFIGAIQGVNKTPNERRVFTFIDEVLAKRIPNLEATLPLLSSAKTIQKIKSLLNCQSLITWLNLPLLLQKNMAANELFLNRQSRCYVDANIDNRDKKYKKLNYLLRLASETPELTFFINGVKKEMANKIHFFEDDNFWQILNRIESKFSEYFSGNKAKISQLAFKHIRYSLIEQENITFKENHRETQQASNLKNDYQHLFSCLDDDNYLEKLTRVIEKEKNILEQKRQSLILELDRLIAFHKKEKDNPSDLLPLHQYLFEGYQQIKARLFTDERLLCTHVDKMFDDLYKKSKLVFKKHLEHATKCHQTTTQLFTFSLSLAISALATLTFLPFSLTLLSLSLSLLLISALCFYKTCKSYQRTKATKQDSVNQLENLLALSKEHMRNFLPTDILATRNNHAASHKKASPVTPSPTFFNKEKPQAPSRLTSFIQSTFCLSFI